MLPSIGDNALDDLVHDYASRAATKVNNAGVETQINYLRDRGMTDEAIVEAGKE